MSFELSFFQGIWTGILKMENIEDSTDFFKSGAASMDVARLEFLLFSMICSSVSLHVCGGGGCSDGGELKY